MLFKNHSFRPAFIIAFVTWMCPSHLVSQNILTEMDHDEGAVYDRMLIITGGGPLTFHSSVFPYWRSDVVALANDYRLTANSGIDLHRVQSIFDHNNEFLPAPAGTRSSKIYADSTKTFYYTP